MICYLPLAKKLFIARLKEYQIFWWCESIMTAVTYAMYAFISDASFLYDYRYVPIQISEGSIQLCFYGIFAVLVLFIPLSHWILFKNRSDDFFTLLSVGFTKENMYEQMIVEHLVMDLSALLAGLLIGTGLSYLLYAAMVYGFGYTHFAFPFHLFSYIEMGKKFILLDVLSIIGIIVGTCRFSIGRIGHLGRIGKRQKGDTQLRNWYGKRAATYYLGQNRLMQIAVILIFTVLITTQVLLVGLIVMQKDDCIQKHNFDLVYVDDGGKTAEYPKVEKWIKKNDIKIKQEKAIQFYRDPIYTMVNVDQVNQIFHTNYKVRQGKYLRVDREYKGYFSPEETKFPFSNIQVRYKDKMERLTEQGVVHHMLYGFVGMSDFVALVNSKDYKHLARQTGDYFELSMYGWDFKDRYSEKRMIDHMQKVLKDDAYSDLYSKHLEESSIEQNEKLSIVFILSLSFSIYFACMIMIYFVSKMERIKQRKEEEILYELGMKEIEIKEVRRCWIRKLFFSPILFSIILAGVLAAKEIVAYQLILPVLISYVIGCLLLVGTHYLFERCYEAIFIASEET